MKKVSPGLLVLLLSYISIASFSAAILAPALPVIQSVFVLTNRSLEWVVSFFLIGYVLGQLIYGLLANRFGRILSLRIGLCVYLLGCVICMVCSRYLNYPGLLFGRFLSGLGSACGLSCTFMFLNELLPPGQAKRSFSYTLISFTVAIGVAVLLGGVVTEYLHWYDCFWLLLMHAVSMLYMTQYLPETWVRDKQVCFHSAVVSFFNAFSNRRLLVFSFVVGGSSMFTYGLHLQHHCLFIHI